MGFRYNLFSFLQPKTRACSVEKLWNTLCSSVRCDEFIFGSLIYLMSKAELNELAFMKPLYSQENHRCLEKILMD